MQVRSSGLPVCAAYPPGSSLGVELAHDGEAVREFRDVGKDRRDSTLLLSPIPS